MKKTPIYLLIALLLSPVAYGQAGNPEIQKRLLEQGELAPLPEAKPLLLEVASVIDSQELKDAVANSNLLMMMRERVKTSLFHLNFKFEVLNDGYPYEPPFKEPFPFRPTLEALDEAERFLGLMEKHTGFKTDVIAKIAAFPYFNDLKVLIPKAQPQGTVTPLTKAQAQAKVVDSYIAFTDRLIAYGEGASFPEFEEATVGVLTQLTSKEVLKRKKMDQAFADVVNEVTREVRAIMKPTGGKATRLYGAFTGSYPYRRTIQTLEKAVLVLDLYERLKYPEGLNWHDVELSWHKGKNPKLLPLYHFNRYKYQLAGLLANPDEILWPYWGGASFEALIRLRSAPIGLLDIAAKTDRIDRHHNSPSDTLHHDSNHNRRMVGYDDRKARQRNATTREQKIAIYREQEAFVNAILEATSIDKSLGLSESEIELRKQVRVIVFETLHETALTPDKESLMYDLTRKPATRQPFEVQVQAPIANLEEIRTFDGNLKSGADQLALNLQNPTTIRFFLDRAPGFLSNVDNKLRWGFFDSIFKMKNYVTKPKFRTPQFLAKAATRLFEILGEKAPPMDELVADMNNHSGQPELWNYFSSRDGGLLKISDLDLLNVTTGDQIHDNWRRESGYDERWKPTNAKLKDGSFVNSPATLQAYFKEKHIPEYLHEFYRLEKDPVSGDMLLYEDLRNLPNQYMANNHQTENMMSGAKAVTAVDRIWRYDLKFETLDDVERWLVAAAQFVHQGVLDRNANGARNNPIYNQHWLLLPAQNQKNDLNLIRIAFEARLKTATRTTIPAARATLIHEAILRLFRKLNNDQPIRSCNFELTDRRNAKLIEEKDL